MATIESDREQVLALLKQHEITPPGDVFEMRLVRNDTGKIIGFGCLNRITEATIAIDKTATSQERAKALKSLWESAVEACKQYGIDQLYAFSNDPRYTRVLYKHFGFKPAVGQLILVDIGEE